LQKVKKFMIKGNLLQRGIYRESRNGNSNTDKEITGLQNYDRGISLEQDHLNH